MGLIEVRLIEGSGKRDTSVRGNKIPRSVWEAQCPACGVDRRFGWEHRSLKVGSALVRLYSDAFFDARRFWTKTLTAPYAIDLVGCSVCKFFMVICCNCRKGFPSDANATIFTCPLCQTANQ